MGKSQKVSETWEVLSPDEGCSVFPTKILFGFMAAVPAAITYFLGMGVITFMVLFLLTAIPTWGIGMLIISNFQQGGKMEGDMSDYVTFNDPAMAKKYKNKKIAMETLVEAYLDQAVDFPQDLYLTLMDRHKFVHFGITLGHLKFFLNNLMPEFFVHSRNQDMTQVREHYDRGDDFYNAFLGPRMVYTGAMYENSKMTLEQAQDAKIKLVCEKVHMKKGEKHLDIGCGWGTLAVSAAKNFGTDSTGVTLALNQTEYGNARAKEAGVSDRCRIKCMDYRDIPKTKFDKITCLEMAEHVGIRKFQSFLLQVKDMMADDGFFYLQIAGLRRAWQYEDLSWGMFMGKYIFPGADASMPLQWVSYQLEKAGFEIHSVENIGIHYSLTIKHWYDNWLRNREYIVKTYGERWYRLWEMFLAWSVIAAGQGSSTAFQIVAHKNSNQFDRRVFLGNRP